MAIASMKGQGNAGSTPSTSSNKRNWPSIEGYARWGARLACLSPLGQWRAATPIALRFKSRLKSGFMPLNQGLRGLAAELKAPTKILKLSGIQNRPWLDKKFIWLRPVTDLWD
ncbi:MAG: hypothetical protein EA342_19710 [Leptolyngbya sp. LCM1.Bin17]|nr:MAG: hypothetical protein EA342_19710 [Leptolyngbya sp. LCM1.Bin17]